MAKKTLALALHGIGAIKFGEFKLKSGLMSPIYIDLRILVAFPAVLKKIADAMVKIANGLRFDLIAGIPYTALPIATAMSLKKDWPMIYTRKEVKDYGTKKKIEGKFHEGQTVLIVDDLITTGDSKFETIEPFEEAGLKVTDLVVLVDREQGGRRLLEGHGYSLHAVLGMHDFLNILKDAGKIEPGVYNKVKEYLAENQV